MPAIPAVAHVLAWAALGTGVGVVLVQQRDLSRRLDEQEARREETSATGSGAPGLAGGKETLAWKAQMDAVAQKESVAASELAKLRADHEKLVAAVLTMPGGAEVEGSSKFVERPGFEDAVRSAIDRYAMEHKFRDTLKKAAGPLVPKKPKYGELAKALELRPEQSARFEQDIRQIQGELYQILQLPRADGITPLEDIMQAEQYPEGSPKRAEAFLRLVKLTIPDTQETYFERAVALASSVKDKTKVYMDDGQRAVLESIDLDWFGIQMPQ